MMASQILICVQLNQILYYAAYLVYNCAWRLSCTATSSAVQCWYNVRSNNVHIDICTAPLGRHFPPWHLARPGQCNGQLGQNQRMAPSSIAQRCSAPITAHQPMAAGDQFLEPQQLSTCATLNVILNQPWLRAVGRLAPQHQKKKKNKKRGIATHNSLPAQQAKSGSAWSFSVPCLTQLGSIT